MGGGVSQSSLPVNQSRDILKPTSTLWSIANDEILNNPYGNVHIDIQKHVVPLSHNERQSLNQGKVQESELTAKLHHEEDELDYDPSEARDKVNIFVCPYCGPHQTFLFEADFLEHVRVSTSCRVPWSSN